MERKTASGIMLILMLIGMLTLAFNTQSVRAEPTTWIVDDDGPADFHTIQEAINAANPGDTIYVEAGTYNERLTITKTNLTLIGENKDITIVDGGGLHMWAVIRIQSTHDVRISGFTVQNGYVSVSLWDSEGITVSGNFITNNYFGLTFEYYVSESDASSNVISDSREIGFVAQVHSDNNVIYNNTIIRNKYGILLSQSSNNMINHNNFINNTLQASVSPESVNTWDKGYPSGGNYWSDYTDVDVKNGPSQNLPGSDGIGDTPYIMNTDNVDHYPLMNPYGAPSPQTYTLAITTTVGGTTNPAPGIYSYTANSTVQVLAIPNANYLFDHWELDSINKGSTNPYTVLMDKDHTLKAVFSPIPPPPKPVGGYSVTINTCVTAEPLTPYLTLIAILTISFTTIRRKTHKKTK